MAAAVLELTADEVAAQEHVEDDGLNHFVCHCTDLRIAGCGRDVSHLAYDPGSIPIDEDCCPLCVVAWPADSTCPWGCACTECWAPER